MSLTLLPGRTQLTWPDDFPDGRCVIDVLSEYPDPGPGAPFLRLSVEQGPFLISTDKVPEHKRVHEFGHARQQGLRRFAVKVTILADPNADDATPRQGALVFGNGTDRVELSIGTVQLPPSTQPAQPAGQQSATATVQSQQAASGDTDGGRKLPVVWLVLAGLLLLAGGGLAWRLTHPPAPAKPDPDPKARIDSVRSSQPQPVVGPPVSPSAVTTGPPSQTQPGIGQVPGGGQMPVTVPVAGQTPGNGSGRNGRGGTGRAVSPRKNTVKKTDPILRPDRHLDPIIGNEPPIIPQSKKP